MKIDLKNQSKVMPIVVVILGMTIIVMAILFFVLEPAPESTVFDLEVGQLNTE